MYSPIPQKGQTKYGNNRWFSYSPKIGRDVNLYSDLEFDNWILVETDPSIKTFCEQPLRISRFEAGRIHQSIFDMWICDVHNEQFFIEVKYKKDLDPNNSKALRSIRQTELQRAWCKENGINYIIRTETDIRGNPIYLANMKQILPYMKNRCSPIETDQHRVLRLLSNTPISLQHIYNELADIPTGRITESVFYLIYKGSVTANIREQPINPQMKVWLN